jgi:FkbM family methyltransferase
MKDGKFIEVGAYDGIVDSVGLFFEETHGWRGLNIEAVPYHFEKLKNNRKNCINIHCAITDSSEDSIEFTQAIHPTLGYNFGNGSIEHNSGHLDELIKTGCSFEHLSVPACRLSNIIKEYSFKADLLILDIEGGELKVLNDLLSLSNLLPNILCIEHTIVGLNNINDINDIMNNTYEYYSSKDNNSFFKLKT